MKKLLADPMLRYLVVGGLMFLAFGDVLDDDRAPIEVSESYAEGLAAIESERTGRTPTDAERARLVERHIEDEALYREALAMGLDEGDVIIRRRLVQKMRFLLDDALVTEPPTEAELAAHLAAQPEAFADAMSFDFEHRFFAAERDAAQIEAARARIEAGNDADSDPFLLAGHALRDRTADDVRRTFGDATVDALASAPIGAWVGPVRSRYGHHLVRVAKRSDHDAPSLDDPKVRRRVHDDLMKVWHAADVRGAVRAIVASYPTKRPEPRAETIAQVQP